MNTSAHATCGGCGSSKKVYTPSVTQTPFALLSLTTGVSVFPSKTKEKPCCSACDEGGSPCGCGSCGDHPQSPAGVFTLAPPTKVRWREEDDQGLPTRVVLSQTGTPNAQGLRTAFKPVLARPKFPPPRRRKTEKAPPPPGTPFGISAGGKTGAAKSKGPQIIRRNIDRELTLGDAMAWLRGIGTPTRIADFATQTADTRLAIVDLKRWINWGATPRRPERDIGAISQALTPTPCDDRARQLGHPVSPGVPYPRSLEEDHFLLDWAHTVGFAWVGEPAYAPPTNEDPQAPCVPNIFVDRPCSMSAVTGILISDELFLTCGHAEVAALLEAVRPGGPYPITHPRATEDCDTSKELGCWGLEGTVGPGDMCLPPDKLGRSLGLLANGRSTNDAVGVYFDYFRDVRGPTGDIIPKSYWGFQNLSARISSLVEFGPSSLDYAILRLSNVPLHPDGGRRGFARLRGWNMASNQRVYTMGFPRLAPLRAVSGRVTDVDISCISLRNDGSLGADRNPGPGGGGCFEASFPSANGMSGAAWLDGDGCVRGVLQGGDVDVDEGPTLGVRVHSIMRESPTLRSLMAEQAPTAWGVPTFTQIGGHQHVLFRGEFEGRASMIHLYRANTEVEWRSRDLGWAIGAPLSLGERPAIWWDPTRNRVNFLYRTADSKLIRLAGDPSGVVDADGRDFTENWDVHEFSDSFPEWRGVRWFSSAGWYSRDDGAQHCVAVGQRDQERRFLAEFWRSGEGFRTRDLSALLNLAEPAASEGVTAWYAGDDYSHIAFIDSAGAVHHAWHNGRGWRGHHIVHRTGRAHGRLTSHYHGGNQRMVFQVGASLKHAYWTGAQWQIRDLIDEAPSLPAPRQPNAESVLCGEERVRLWYISAEGQLVGVDLSTLRRISWPARQSPTVGEPGLVRLKHLSPSQPASKDRLVGVGVDGQVYYQTSERAMSLQARTGWPLGWRYLPKVGRTR